jgi:hypothetical protein
LRLKKEAKKTSTGTKFQYEEKNPSFGFATIGVCSVAQWKRKLALLFHWATETNIPSVI